ncbi:protein MSP1, putative [Pediculus humanus corporis]|uniref:Protein MSP1, putative n=1 Tax=Pediculus humanus subsp. corporis TaxID=121224 RepID=E0VA54_PEDHC|nr:protein MSP1, putative [Pediculus humanus corporis]EEB10260.1 protein MSP1, putative [Pediculus humanus corporis]
MLQVKKNTYTFQDICGLNQVKETLLNIFIYPNLFPHLFPKKFRWNLILFYGPPGTGKTMLAQAIANEMRALLYRVSSADVLSHWQGENLFRELKTMSKTTILFFDEIDGLCRKRTTTEEDSIRRVKTELLTQLDDFGSEPENYHIYILGATNCPWELDSGFIRRFRKQIYVPLPEK